MDGSVREIDRIVNNMLTLKRSLEYGSQIIYGMETGEPQVIYGNVMNDGLIDNLPQDCCVEVPCLVDKNGVQPVHVGALPVHLAALMQTNINVQRLTVEAALTGKREHIYHAAMLDPHTAAELDLEQTWSLVDDMIEAHGDMLPAYA
jgi:alpha-galactosidase